MCSTSPFNFFKRLVAFTFTFTFHQHGYLSFMLLSWDNTSIMHSFIYWFILSLLSKINIIKSSNFSSPSGMSWETPHLSKIFLIVNIFLLNLEFLPYSFFCELHPLISLSSLQQHAFVLFQHLVYWLAVAFIMMAREKIAFANNLCTPNLITMRCWFVGFRKIPPLHINYTMVEGKCGLFFKYGKKFKNL